MYRKFQHQQKALFPEPFLAITFFPSRSTPAQNHRTSSVQTRVTSTQSLATRHEDNSHAGVHGRARQVKPQQRLELSAQGSVFRLPGSHQPLQHLRKSPCAVFTSRTLPPLWHCRLQRNSRAWRGCRTLTSPISSLTTGTTPLTLVKPW